MALTSSCRRIWCNRRCHNATTVSLHRHSRRVTEGITGSDGGGELGWMTATNRRVPGNGGNADRQKNSSLVAARSEPLHSIIPHQLHKYQPPCILNEPAPDQYIGNKLKGQGEFWRVQGWLRRYINVNKEDISMNINLNQFVEWQQAKPRRHFNIEFGSPSDASYIRVWVWDYNLGEGQSVTSVDEIDLEGKVAAKERAEFERLQAKYRGGNGEMKEETQCQTTPTS